MTELSFNPEQRRKRRNVLLYFWSGEGWRRLPQGEVRVGAGSCHWSRPGWAYACRQMPDKPLGITAIHFDFVDADGCVVPSGDLDLPCEVLHVQDHGLVEQVTAHIAGLAMHYRAGATVHPESMDGAEQMLRGLLLTLSAEVSIPSRSGRQSPADEMWLEVVRYIHENLHSPPTQQQLAERWGYTRSHFSRLFKSRLGVSPQQYVLRARIARAKELLRETNAPIRGIGEMTGFTETSQFSRRFRSMTGTTPAQYRRYAGVDPV
jgi:AraC-like DNA-binding protein